MKYITVNGQEYPVFFTLSAISEVTKLLGAEQARAQDLALLGEFPIERGGELVYCGIKGGKQASKGDYKLPKKADVLDAAELDPKLFFTAFQAMNDSLTESEAPNEQGN